MTSAGDIIAERYRIEAPIGEGGMGAVFRATHLGLGRTVAIKLVRSEDPSEQSLERFMREAKSAASVDHRNVVDVLDFGREPNGQRPYLVMECLAGESLESRLRRPPSPSLDEIVQWIAGALSGLAAIHDAGIIHRDLKPANLFLAEDADGIVPKVLDFGIARPTQEASALTHTMQTLGTPHYMSPEQVRSAKTVDARSDLYAVGVMLYLAVTGKLPFDGPSATAVIAAIVTDDPVPVSELRPDLGAAMCKVIHKAMARQPKDRFESARAMRQALLDALRGLDPSVSADRASDRPSFTQAPTVMAASGGITEPSRPVPPKARTSRRGFFSMLGVLSTLLVAGLAGSYALQTSSEMSPSAVAPGAFADMDEGMGGTEEIARGETRAPRAPGGAASTAGPPPPSAVVAAAAAAPTEEGLSRIGAPGPLDQVALNLRSFSAADRAASRIATDGSLYWLLVPPHIAADGAGAVADEAPRERARLIPTLLHTNVRANVRAEPRETSALLATLPDETLVIALSPEGAASAENDGDARWTQVVVARDLMGWVATSLLLPHSDCVPDAATIGPTDTWVARAHIVLDGAPTDALLFFGPDDGGTVRVASVDPICRATPLAEFRVPSGQLSDLFLTRTAPDGETLVVLGRWPVRGRVPADGMMSWSVHRLSDPTRAVLTLDIPSGQNLPDARRTGIGGPYEEGSSWYPLRIRERRAVTYYVWDGERLTPAPTPPRVEPAD